MFLIAGEKLYVRVSLEIAEIFLLFPISSGFSIAVKR